MSRRDEEFKHRTSIFEGAYRAWSHLGQLSPQDLQTKSVRDVDPLTYPLVSTGTHSNQHNSDGSARQVYHYEPLPRSGLSHPYVKAVLSPWLGPDADDKAVQFGLATLRTWWQHRRKGENKTSVKALGSEKMRIVVDKYTRHFFELAHCLVVYDQAQPPRGLHAKIKEIEKANGRRGGGGSGVLAPEALEAVRQDLTNPNLNPLEKIAAAQMHQQSSSRTAVNPINVHGKCIPGKIDLPSLMVKVNLHASRPSPTGGPNSHAAEYGDPNSTPVVFEGADGILQIVLSVDGITCAHCVKIVETVLRGCNSNNKSPIAGLLDAAADHDLSSVLIRIDSANSAKRIAFEAARNLSLVGYTAKPREISVDQEEGMGLAFNAFAEVAQTSPLNFFDWAAPCSCPDTGVFRGDCARHSQMNSKLFGTFDYREIRVKEFIAAASLPNEDVQHMDSEDEENDDELYETVEPIVFHGYAEQQHLQQHQPHHPHHQEPLSILLHAAYGAPPMVPLRAPFYNPEVSFGSVGPIAPDMSGLSMHWEHPDCDFNYDYEVDDLTAAAAACDDQVDAPPCKLSFQRAPAPAVRAGEEGQSRAYAM